MNILDVRNSPEERKLVEQSIKGHNRLHGSKYIRPTTNIFGSYNDSHKPFIDYRDLTVEQIEEAIINNKYKLEDESSDQTNVEVTELQTDSNGEA